MPSFLPVRRVPALCVLIGLCGIASFGDALAQETGFPSRNVNVIGPTPPEFPPADTGLKQQNEPYCTILPNNPLHVCCGFNDYRGVEIPEIGDAWMGLACSRDGGHHFESFLIPGHGADPQHALEDVEFGADPTLLGLPGAAVYTYIASDRVTEVGGHYAQLLLQPNQEDGRVLVPVGGPALVNKTTPGRFLDKSHAVIMLQPPGSGTATLSGPAPDGTLLSRQVPAFDLFVGATIFTGNGDSTKVVIWKATNGLDFGNGSKISESQEINQGVSIATMGETICAVWRRFKSGAVSDAILYSCSTDRGKRWAKPKFVKEGICPFDQGTTAVSFRTNALPSIASDGKDFYVFWADRGFAADSGGAQGCATGRGLARIVYSKGRGTGSWSAPVPVDERPGIFGFQFQPAAAGDKDQVVVAWHDTRDDEVQAFSDGFIADFFDQNGNLRRHTADVRAAKILNGAVQPSVKVSQYRKGILPFETEEKQLDFDRLNARAFRTGTTPFHGDYLTVGQRLMKQNGAGDWVAANSFANPEDPVSFFIAWTDNRDIRGDAWGDLAAPTGYTPPTLFGEPAPDNPGECVPGNPATELDRTREQNVYGSRFDPGTVLTAPAGVKPLGSLQRAVPVFLRNSTNEDKRYRLTILNQPADAPNPGRASWRQLPAPPFDGTEGPPITQIDVLVYRRSSGTRTVHLSSGIERPEIRVQAVDITDPANPAPETAEVTLNADILAPDLENPDWENPDFENFDILSVEIHNPDWENNSVVVIRVDNPDLENPDLENPDWENIDPANPDYENPDYENPDLENPDYENLEIAFPDLENPDLENASITAGDLANGYTDYVWPMRNRGNTTSAYTAQAFVSGALEEGVKAQLIVTTTYTTPTSQDCDPGLLGENQVIVNIPDPTIDGIETPDLENPALEDAATFWLPPGFRGNVILRVTGPQIDPARVGTFVAAQSCNNLEGVIDPNCDEPNFITAVADFTAPEFDSVLIDLLGIEAEGPDGARVHFEASATDPEEGPVPVACVPMSGDLFPLGNTVTVCTASDSVGNTASQAFNVEVVDTVPPTLSVPPDGIRVPATGPSGATVDFLAELGANDLVDVDPTVTCSDAAGELTSPADFPVGDTLVTCTASDDSGNSSAPASFTVSVTDETAPDLTVPAAPVAVEATGPQTTVDILSLVSASDAIDPNPVVSCDHDSQFPLGDTLVTCTATDASGNSSTDQFTVRVQDTQPPVLTVPPEVIAVATGAGGAIVNFAGLVTAVDTADPAPVVICTPSSGSTFALGTTPVTCQATDSAGNGSGFAGFEVRVQYGFLGPKSPYQPPPKKFRAGSSTPINWNYTNASGSVIDSSAADPLITIRGPFALDSPNNQCVDTGGSIVSQNEEDPGDSGLRYSAGGNEWQLNWLGVFPGTNDPLPAGCYIIEIETRLTGQLNGPFPIQLR